MKVSTLIYIRNLIGEELGRMMKSLELAMSNLEEDKQIMDMWPPNKKEAHCRELMESIKYARDRINAAESALKDLDAHDWH